MKQSLEKQLSVEADAVLRVWLRQRLVSRRVIDDIGKSKGFWQLKWLHLKGQSIKRMERIKTNLGSEGGRILGKPDERCNSLDSGRTRRNCLEVYRKHNWMQIMVRHGINTSELWKKLPWKKFQKTLFRLQKRVFKAVQVNDKRKARSLQKLILKSQAARLLAIRQVTQLNAGKKTAGIDQYLSQITKVRLL